MNQGEFYNKWGSGDYDYFYQNNPKACGAEPYDTIDQWLTSAGRIPMTGAPKASGTVIWTGSRSRVIWDGLPDGADPTFHGKHFTDAFDAARTADELAGDLSDWGGTFEVFIDHDPMLGTVWRTCWVPMEKAQTKSKGHVHEWKNYVGFTERYDFCASCDEKRPAKD